MESEKGWTRLIWRWCAQLHQTVKSQTAQDCDPLYNCNIAVSEFCPIPSIHYKILNIVEHLSLYIQKHLSLHTVGGSPRQSREQRGAVRYSQVQLCAARYSAEKTYHVLCFQKAGASRISNMILRGHKKCPKKVSQ